VIGFKVWHAPLAMHINYHFFSAGVSAPKKRPYGSNPFSKDYHFASSAFSFFRFDPNLTVSFSSRSVKPSFLVAFLPFRTFAYW